MQGPDALAVVDSVITNDVAKLKILMRKISQIDGVYDVQRT